MDEIIPTATRLIDSVVDSIYIEKDCIEKNQPSGEGCLTRGMIWLEVTRHKNMILYVGSLDCPSLLSKTRLEGAAEIEPSGLLVDKLTL